MSSERGGIMLGGILLITALFLGVVSVDLTRYYAQRERVQFLLDRRALNASKFIIDKDVESFASRAISLGKNQFILNATSWLDGLAIEGNGVAKLLFAELFGLEIGLPITLQAEVRMRPVDLIFLVEVEFIERAAALYDDLGEILELYNNHFTLNQLREASFSSLTLEPVSLAQDLFQQLPMVTSRGSLADSPSRVVLVISYGQSILSKEQIERINAISSIQFFNFWISDRESPELVELINHEQKTLIGRNSKITSYGFNSDAEFIGFGIPYLLYQIEEGVISR